MRRLDNKIGRKQTETKSKLEEKKQKQTGFNS